MSAPESSEQTLKRIVGERRDKAAAMRDAGTSPYRNDLRPTHTTADVRRRYDGTKPAEASVAKGAGIEPIDGEVISLAGRVVARRGFGKTVFIPLRDATGDLQLFLNVDHTEPGDFDGVLPKLDVGDIVWAEGVAFWTKRGELSLLTRRFQILTKSLRPLPDKWHGLTDVEIRYRQRYLDMATNPEVREVFRKRSQIISGLRRFLDARDYLEVETPMMHPIIGGAAARPFVTHHNALDMKLYMRIAPELYLKRLVVGGFDRVYEVSRVFRNEGLSRSHNPEFTMLEFYQAYSTYEDLMELTEEMIVGLAEEVSGTTKLHWDGADIDLAAPWKRLSVRDAVLSQPGINQGVFDDAAVAAETAIAVGLDAGLVGALLLEGLDAEATAEVVGTDRAAFLQRFARAEERPKLAQAIIERYQDEMTGRVRAGHIGYMIFDHKVEDQLVQPTFLTDFPLAVSPLARKKESDPAFCDRFELFVAGKEIANAFSELNDADDQRARFLDQLRAREHGADETMDYDEDYCRALELGMPPAAGEGIGVDRLVMLLTGQSSIRDVILFPQMRPEV